MSTNDVVLGPAPCRTCGAWVEWLGVGPWVALESHLPHECEPYLRGQAHAQVVTDELHVWGPGWQQKLQQVLAAQPEALTWRLVVGLALVAVFFALVLVRYQAGLL